MMAKLLLLLCLAKIVQHVVVTGGIVEPTKLPKFTRHLRISLSPEDPAIAIVSERFISFTLDWWPSNKGCWPEGWGPNANVLQIDFKSPKLRALTKALGPAILRIGGSLDKVVAYDMPGGNWCHSQKDDDSNICLNRSRWDDLHDFAESTNSKIVFGLSYPNTDGVWNSSQANALFEYSISKNYSRITSLYGFELGEELSGYKVGTPQFKAYTQAYRECALRLRYLWPPSTKPALLGPCPGMDWPNLSHWFPSFLNAVRGALDVAVYHSYNQIQPNPPDRMVYLNTSIPSGNLSTQHGTSPGGTGWQAVAMSQWAKNAAVPLWLGEFGPHNGGGGGTYASTFVSSFAYLDTLGVSARLGHQVLARQTLVGGNYELLRCSSGQTKGPESNAGCDFEPHPDYWVALLWKQLMGQIVLPAPNLPERVEPVRFHTHCTAGINNGSITVAFSNFHPTITYAIIPLGVLDGRRVEFILRSCIQGDEDYSTVAYDKRVLELNGKVLRARGNPVNIPKNGQYVSKNIPFKISPVTIGFAIFPDANYKACKVGLTQKPRKGGEAAGSEIVHGS